MLIHSLFALLIAVLLAGLFAGSYRRDEGWRALALSFFLIFFASWAGGLWLTPVGPLLWGVSWLPYLLTGLIFALLLAAGGGLNTSSSAKSPTTVTEEQAVEYAVGGLLWLLIVLLVLSILAHYIWMTPAYIPQS